MIPALRSRISSLLALLVNSFAVAATLDRSVRSQCRYSILALGTAALMSAMAARALSLLRAARYIVLGLCFESWRMLSLPRPTLPVKC